MTTQTTINIIFGVVLIILLTSSIRLTRIVIDLQQNQLKQLELSTTHVEAWKNQVEINKLIVEKIL